MNNRQLNRLEAKNQKALDKAHRTLFKNVRSKIRRIKGLIKTDKTALIADIMNANGDLMHLLATAEQPKTVDDYLDTINAYLSLEMKAYDYKGVVLAYEVGKMELIMEVIRLNHNTRERYEALKAKIFEE